MYQFFLECNIVLLRMSQERARESERERERERESERARERESERAREREYHSIIHDADFGSPERGRDMSMEQ